MSLSRLLPSAGGRLASFALVAIALIIVLLAVELHSGPPRAEAAVVWAVGDGGDAGPGDDAVAAMIEREGVDRFLFLGDVYEHGTAEEFARNYHPSYGRFKSISSPTPGNHEWSNRAQGYDPYWGSRAPQTSGGHYYSFDFGGWRIISLNSEEDASAGSPQLDWLRRDLATYTGTCTIAFWHAPRYSATGERSNTTYEPFWAALAGRAPIVLSGHAHNYQRFAPERGITQFVAGAGGRTRYAADESDPRLRAVNDEVDGALRLDLQPGRAAFEYVAVDGRRLDSGSFTCTPNQPAAAPASSVTPAPAPPAAAPAVTPAVRVVTPRRRAVHTRRLRRLRGTAAVPAGASVKLTIVRRRGRECRAFDGRGWRGSCRRLPLLGTRGTTRWSRTLPPRPRPGAYRLVARVVDAQGRVLARSASDFRIR